MTEQQDTLLRVSELKTHFRTEQGVVRAVDGIDFEIKRGETFGIVGESGCGKSVTAYSIMQLIERPQGDIVSGSIEYQGRWRPPGRYRGAGPERSGDAQFARQRDWHDFPGTDDLAQSYLYHR